MRLDTTKRITVSQRDIDNGVPGSIEDCALALAIRRATRQPLRVGIGSVYHAKTGKTVAWLPLVAQQFRAAFDRHRPVVPISFKLTPQPPPEAPPPSPPPGS